MNLWTLWVQLIKAASWQWASGWSGWIWGPGGCWLRNFIDHQLFGGPTYITRYRYSIFWCSGNSGVDVQVTQVLFLRRCCRNNQEDRKKHRLFFLWEGIDQIFRQTSRTPSTKPWWNTTRVTALVGMLLAMHIATWLIRQGGFMDAASQFGAVQTVQNDMAAALNTWNQLPGKGLVHGQVQELLF